SPPHALGAPLASRSAVHRVGPRCHIAAPAPRTLPTLWCEGGRLCLAWPRSPLGHPGFVFALLRLTLGGRPAGTRIIPARERAVASIGPRGGVLGAARFAHLVGTVPVGGVGLVVVASAQPSRSVGLVAFVELACTLR